MSVRTGRRRSSTTEGTKKFIGVTAAIQPISSYSEFPGEKYYSLYYKQHRIERDNAILVYNRPVVWWSIRRMAAQTICCLNVRNPKGFLRRAEVCAGYALTLRRRANAPIHYVAESLLAGGLGVLFTHAQERLDPALCPNGSGGIFGSGGGRRRENCDGTPLFWRLSRICFPVFSIMCGKPPIIHG